MRNTPSLLLTSMLLTLASCESQKDEAAAASYYPALSVIWEETKALDTLPLAVIRYREIGTAADTAIVEKSAFRESALKALGPDISKPPLSKLYREEVFMDGTLGRVVIRYQTEDPDAEIRLLELTLDPDREKVKSVYVEKTGRSGDTLLTAKTLWTVGRQYQTNLIRRVGEVPLPPVRERYVWGLEP
jgi:hypothetical protein